MIGARPNIQPLGASSKTAFCLFAPPGYGKTRFAGSGKDTLIIRPPTDHTDSIRGGQARNVQELIVYGWDDMLQAQHWATSSKEAQEFRWVWLDSISMFQDTGLDNLWAQVIAEKPHRARFGLDKQEYGINMHRLSGWVRHMASSGPFNFGVTAHPFWGENIDGDSLLMPYVQGKQMAEKVCGCMNVVGFMDVKKIKLKGETEATKRRVIYFDASDRYYAKDQFDAFPNGRLVDPTLPAFEKLIEAARRREAVTTPKRTIKRKGK